MLEKIRIQNFKCLRDVEVDLGPLNVLIGPNDSGKSSFLQAIGVFRVGSIGNTPESMIWNRDKRLTPTLTVTGDSQTLEFALSSPQSRAFSFGGEFLENLASSETYRLNPRLLRGESQARNETRLNAEGSNLAAVLHAMLIGADRRTFFEIEKQFCAEIPTLKEISTPVAAPPGTHRIEFSLNIDITPPVTISAEEASDGAMLLLAFLVIVHGRAPDILMIEEPENGLHPSRLKMVIDLLRMISKGEIGNKPRQVIITTHSPLLLNFVEPSEVRIFRRDPQTGTEIKAMDKIPNIERLSKDFAPGELWYLYGEEDLVTGHAT